MQLSLFLAEGRVTQWKWWAKRTRDRLAETDLSPTARFPRIRGPPGPNIHLLPPEFRYTDTRISAQGCAKKQKGTVFHDRTTRSFNGERGCPALTGR